MMRHAKWVCVVTVLMGTVFVAAAVSHAAAKAESKGAGEPGFVKIFNGKDLTGWEAGRKRGQEPFSSSARGR